MARACAFDLALLEYAAAEPSRVMALSRVPLRRALAHIFPPAPVLGSSYRPEERAMRKFDVQAEIATIMAFGLIAGCWGFLIALPMLP